MKILVNQIPPQRVVIELNPNNYFLKNLHNDKGLLPDDYALVHRIDMSYCGKSDQEGDVFMYVSEREAEQLKGIFDEIL